MCLRHQFQYCKVIKQNYTRDFWSPRIRPIHILFGSWHGLGPGLSIYLVILLMIWFQKTMTPQKACLSSWIFLLLKVVILLARLSSSTTFRILFFRAKLNQYSIALVWHKFRSCATQQVSVQNLIRSIVSKFLIGRPEGIMN